MERTSITKEITHSNRHDIQKMLLQILCLCWFHAFHSHAFEPINYITKVPVYLKKEVSLEPIVKIHKPSGISFIFERAKHIRQVHLYININHPFNGSVPYLLGDISDFKVNEYRESPIEYRNNRIKLRVGDKVYYWYIIIFNDLTNFDKTNMSFVVTESVNGELIPVPFPSYHIVNDVSIYD